MERFFNTNHNVSNIVLACFVAAGTGATIHKNRTSHGLALNRGGEKQYTFSNGTRHTVKHNDIIYLPKNSNYTVTTHTTGDTYCINFQLAETQTFQPFVFHLKNPDEALYAYKTQKRHGGAEKADMSFYANPSCIKSYIYYKATTFALTCPIQSKRYLPLPFPIYISIT